MKATFSSSVTSLSSKNKATYVLKYKKSTDSSYTSVTLSNYANNYAVSGGYYVFAADVSSSYNVILTLSDNFRSVSVNGTGSTASKTVSLYKEGKGIAFGKIAEKSNAFECAYTMYDRFGEQVGNGLVTSLENDPDTTNQHLILTTNNTPSGKYMYILTFFYQSKDSATLSGYSRMQVAFPYHYDGTIYYRYYFFNYKVWSNWYTIASNAEGSKVKLLSTGSTWLSGKTTSNASINISTQQSQSSYHPYMAIKSYSGHVWNIGGLGNYVGIYGYYSSTTANQTDWRTYWDTATGNLSHHQNLYRSNGKYIYSKNTSGTDFSILGISGSNNVFLGYSAGTGLGDTNIYSCGAMNFLTQIGDSYVGHKLELYREQSGSFRTILCSNTTGAIYLGASSKRYNTAFFTNAITASDLKEKAVIEDFDFKAKDFIMNLKPIAYTRTSATDGGKRIHMGFGAQTVAKTIKDLDMGDLAMVQASIVYEDGQDEETGETIIKEKPYTGEEIDDAKLLWGINYSEIIPEVVKHNQEQQKEIDSLKEEVQQLKEMVAKLVS